MLSKKKLDELLLLVQKTYPNFNGFKRQSESSYMNHSGKVQDCPDKRMGIPNFSMIASCCGAYNITAIPGAKPDLPGAASPLAEQATGLYNFPTWDETQSALFALMCHARDANSFITAISVGTHTGVNKTDKVFLNAGFEAVSRCLNNAHGPNHLTFWVLDLGKEDLLPVEIPRKKRLAVEVKELVEKRRKPVVKS